MKVCSVDGCEGKFLARNMCRKHYARAYSKGILEPIERSCKVSKCLKKHAAKDYCNSHYKKSKRYNVDQIQLSLLEAITQCQVCSTSLTYGRNDRTRHCIDHDHETGLIRGVLCGRCNVALGLLRDCPVQCRSAIDFLQTHISIPEFPKRPLDRKGFCNCGKEISAGTQCDSCRNRSFSFGIGEPYDLIQHLTNRQAGLCPISRESIVQNRVVDHDHQTGHIRGLLTNSANIAIGMFGEDVKIISLAESYLLYSPKPLGNYFCKI